MQWCKDKLKEAQKRMEKITSYTIAEELNGSYMSFRKVWDHEGLDEAGYEAHISHQSQGCLAKCMLQVCAVTFST